MVVFVVDVINIDFEDLVVLSDKEMVCVNVIEVINMVDWGNKYLFVWINGLDIFYWYCDVVDLLE